MHTWRRASSVAAIAFSQWASEDVRPLRSCKEYVGVYT